MRQIFLAMFAIVMLVACSSKEATKPTEHEDLSYTYQDEGLELSMKAKKESYTTFLNEITFIIEQKGETAVRFGRPFIVEKYKNGKWYKVPFKDRIGFDGLGYELENGGTIEHTYEMANYFNGWDKGIYRLVKEFDVKDSSKEIMLGAVFKVE